MNFNLVKINETVIFKKKFKSIVHLIVNANEDSAECVKSFTQSFEWKKHYYDNKFSSPSGLDDFRFVYISTAGRCGTWWHKYFFKFYSDLVAKYPLHIGIKLPNPLACETLSTLFFTGHILFPLEVYKYNENKISFFMNNKSRVARVNPDFFNAHATSIRVIKAVREKFDGYVPSKFYYIYRNVFDQFTSMFLLANRSKNNLQNFTLFQYTKKFLLEPFAFQFLT
ncbi:MAG: hypothetical protein CMP38_07340, partial [Rickettsiales bacterium]